MTCRISQDELKRWFTYEPDTGRFFWRERPVKAKVNVGDEAGSIQTMRTGGKRRMLWVSARRIYASRAAYIYVHGDIPDGALVDHADGDTLNDRIDNLRLASTAQNVWNRLRVSRSGLPIGVQKDARGRFKARIQMTDGRKANLGTWRTAEEAHAAYMGAAAILHSEFWVGARPDWKGL